MWVTKKETRKKSTRAPRAWHGLTLGLTGHLRLQEQGMQICIQFLLHVTIQWYNYVELNNDT